jgi:hypothetical protein
MFAGGNESGPVSDRRVTQRRSSMDRRYGERRRPERAVAGRRVLVVDRRASERRIVESAAFSPA